jgi:Domain of unknown function (DUF4124)
MKHPFLTLALVLVCGLPLAAQAQWLWVDNNGRKIFSDRAPPSDIPDKNILKRPGPRPVAAAAATPASGAASRAAVARPPASAASGPLDAQKKKAEDEAAAKQKDADAQQGKERAANCERAKASLAALNTGQRIRTPNAKGEMEVMGDDARLAETRRVQGIVTMECK